VQFKDAEKGLRVNRSAGQKQSRSFASAGQEPQPVVSREGPIAREPQAKSTGNVEKREQVFVEAAQVSVAEGNTMGLESFNRTMDGRRFPVTDVQNRSYPSCGFPEMHGLRKKVPVEVGAFLSPA
jgi:hypothetical protein